MATVVELFSFQPHTYRVSLRRLYRELDRMVLFPQNIPDCKNLFTQIRGRFLCISRKKKNMSLQEAATHIGVPWYFLEIVERGCAPIYDDSFQRLCQFYGTYEESFIFTQKIEKVLRPKKPQHKTSSRYHKAPERTPKKT